MSPSIHSGTLYQQLVVALAHIAHHPLRPVSLMDLSLLSRARVNLALNSAWADSTLSKYCSIISQFLSFCDQECIPAHAHCPASEHLLCAFTASRVGSLSGSMVHNHMVALKAWHAYLDKPWLGSVHLNYMINGVTNLALASSKCPPCPPITRSMLLILASKLDPTNSFDICCLAATTCATWGQLRLGEILSQWECSFLDSHIPCRLDLAPPLNSNGSRKLHLPFTKVKKTQGEYVIICHQRDASDPIGALDHHLKVNCPDANLPLFCFYSASGLRCLTCKNFLAQCNSIWSDAALATSSGHSFRIGGTTEFLLSGVPPDVVKVLGRWSSNSFLRYWRLLELLTPLHIENL